jgi:hypothetical protein
MTELLERPRPKASSSILVLLVIVLAVLGAGGYLIYRFAIVSPRTAAPRSSAVSEAVAQTERQEFVFQDEAMTRWFNLDDTIGFPLNGDTYRLQILDIGRTLTVKVPGGTLDMPVGQDRQLDMNGDGRDDLRILVNDLDATEVAKRANLSLYKITKAATSPQIAEAEEIEEAEENTEAEEPESVESAAEEAAAVEPAAGATTILTADSPAPFRVSISFRGYCLLRYLVDNDIREERFFHKGESFSLDAKNGVRLWISNAGVVRLMVAGKDLEVGRPGAVTTKEIRWRRDEESGRYVLEAATTE